MSRKSIDSLKTRARGEPFDVDVLRRARKTADQYRIVLEPDKELGYVGSCIEMPTVFADGQTPDACVSATREALSIAAATLIERGERPPSPSSHALRKTQVNIRLTADEKFWLSEAAHRLGFKGLADFMRTAALERAVSI